MSKLGQYDFKVKAYYGIQPTAEVSATFKIDLIDCSLLFLNNDANIWRNEIYFIPSDVKTLIWNPSATGDVLCGNVIWSLTMADNSLIDQTIFTADFSNPIKTL